MKTLVSCLILSVLVFQIVRSQNVGIGISNPAYARVMVNGSVGNAVAMFGSDNYGIAVGSVVPEIGFNCYNNGGNKTMKAGYAANIGMDPANGSFYMGNFNGNQSASNFDVITGYQKVITITQSGKVGIHIANPTSALEIYSTTDNAAALPGLRLTVSNSYGVCSWNVFAYDGGAFSNDLNFALFGTTKAGISGLNGGYYNVSDRSCKKEIEYINDGGMLSKLMQLKPATYFMKDEPINNNKQLGFISQDVELLFPQVIAMMGGIKMMNYSGLIPVAVQSIKEQQEEILELKKENEVLRADLLEIRKILSNKLPD